MLLRRSPQRPSALPGSVVVLPRISSMRSPCPTQPCSQSSSTRRSVRSQQRQSVPQTREAERVQFSSDGAQEGQVLGSRSSATEAAVPAEGGSCPHFCPPPVPVQQGPRSTPPFARPPAPQGQP